MFPSLETASPITHRLPSRRLVQVVQPDLVFLARFHESQVADWNGFKFRKGQRAADRR